MSNFLSIIPALLLALFFGLGVKLNIDISLNTILLIAGNFAIAYYIASKINLQNKHKELSIERCFKDIEIFEEYLKSAVAMDTASADEYLINKTNSFTNLLTEMLSKYSFIEKEHIEKLKGYCITLSREFDPSGVDQNYKNTIMQIEKRLLVIKSSILSNIH